MQAMCSTWWGLAQKRWWTLMPTERIRARYRSGRAWTGWHGSASSSPLGTWRDLRADGPRHMRPRHEQLTVQNSDRATGRSHLKTLFVSVCIPVFIFPSHKPWQESIARPRPPALVKSGFLSQRCTPFSDGLIFQQSSTCRFSWRG